MFVKLQLRNLAYFAELVRPTGMFEYRMFEYHSRVRHTHATLHSCLVPLLCCKHVRGTCLCLWVVPDVSQNAGILAAAQECTTPPSTDPRSNDDAVLVMEVTDPHGRIVTLHLFAHNLADPAAAIKKFCVLHGFLGVETCARGIMRRLAWTDLDQS